MAEGLFRHLVAGRESEFIIGSAGVGAVDGYPASTETIRVMKEHGIDVSQHRSRRLTSAMVRTADRILVMENMHRAAILGTWPEASEKTKLLTEYSRKESGRGLEIDIPDPIRMPDSFYKNVFLVIRECVARVAEEMKEAS